MIFNFLKPKIKKGDVYAVQAGDFVGQFFNFIKKDGDEYVFLSTPMMEIQRVPKEKFDFAKEQGIIEYIENLPRNIFQVIEAEYQHQSKKIGRDSK
jgi:hypothetical protein